MTSLLILAAFGLWSAAMLHYGRSALFPPALLSIVWTATLLALWLCGDLYFPVTLTAQVIVLTGVLAFSFGGILAVAAPLRRGMRLNDISPRRKRQVSQWLDLAAILAILNIPLAYLHFQIVGQSIAPRESVWRQIRIATSKANISGQTSLSLESVILPFLTIMALIAVRESVEDGHRKARAVLLLILAAGYQLLNGARSEVLLLLVSSVVLVWLKKGAPPTRQLFLVAVAFLLAFSAGQIWMGKYGASRDNSVTQNLHYVAQGFGTYWLGGIIAFDQNRQNPELKYGWSLGKFAARIANHFGAHFPERDRNLEYTRISPSQITNVYTVFLPYYMDHGALWGSISLMLLVGFLSTYVYRSAIYGSCWAVFTLGAFIYATLMTVFSEEYFAQITFWIKAGTLSMLVYHMPALTPRLTSRSPAHKPWKEPPPAIPLVTRRPN
jgi:oligosaccharide repeat unit polymerase